MSALSWKIYVPPSYFKRIREEYGKDEVMIIGEEGDNLILKVPYGFVGPSHAKIIQTQRSDTDE